MDQGRDTPGPGDSAARADRLVAKGIEDLRGGHGRQYHAELFRTKFHPPPGRTGAIVCAPGPDCNPTQLSRPGPGFQSFGQRFGDLRREYGAATGGGRWIRLVSVFQVMLNLLPHEPGWWNLVDTRDLKSLALRVRAGSIPAPGTKEKQGSGQSRTTPCFRLRPVLPPKLFPVTGVSLFYSEYQWLCRQ